MGHRAVRSCVMCDRDYYVVMLHDMAGRDAPGRCSHTSPAGPSATTGGRCVRRHWCPGKVPVLWQVDAVRTLSAAFADADAVVHLAWAIHPGTGDPPMHRTNAVGSANVLLAASRAGVRQPGLCFLGSGLLPWRTLAASG
jgi:nucleoside-diphosphate-sugar epimerase